jgi:signal transduction histidine kinase
VNEFTFPDGAMGWFELRFVPVPAGACVLSLDITNARRAEAAAARSESQLRHAQKMEVAGRLASGVAHDFNNLLSIVLSYAELALSELGEEDPLREALEEIQGAGVRASSLTRQLLTMGRRQLWHPRAVALHDIVDGMANMLARAVGEKVGLRVSSSSSESVLVDPGAIEQVVLNLALNARDAMPTGGRLTVETGDVGPDDELGSHDTVSRPFDYMLLKVTDTGAGMTPAVQAKAFEPFFTTKDAERGSGLGLSMVLGIIEQHGGHIHIDSAPGRGTTVRVYLPRAEQSGAVPLPSRLSGCPRDESPGHIPQ